MAKVDGIDHINVYSRGKTELGRLLSNFAHTPFTIDSNTFESIEGYWFWLLSELPERDILKTLYGYKAKEKGSELRTILEYNDEFKENIYRAIRAKITQHDNIKQLLIKSTLPFDHYYVYGSKIVRTSHGWTLDIIEKIREEIKNGN